MNDLPTYSLDAAWHCEYFELDPDLYEFMDGGLAVASLADWHCEARFNVGWAAWLQRTFTLTPTDDCVNYHLDIDAAPGATQVYINNQRVSAVSAPVKLDVTALVALGDNTIAFRVECGGGGYFGDVRLQTIPCI